MRTGRPKAPIILSQEENEQLLSISKSRPMTQAVVNRARIILMAAEGAPNHAITEKVKLSPQMICK